MFDKILACYDLSEPSKHALQWALKLAWTFRSQLKIVHTLTERDRPLGKDDQERSLEFIKRVREKIDEEARLLSKVGTEVQLKTLEVEVLEDHPVVGLLKDIRGTNPDLVVLATHGRTGIFRFLLGSCAEKIIRHSPSPVLAVRKAPGWPPKKLLVPIDFSEASEEALLMASQLAKTVPMEIELLHVLWLPDLTVYAESENIPRTPIQADLLKKEAKDRLDKIIAEHPSLKMTAHVAIGPISEAIIERAKVSQADLILTPTHGRTGIGRLLMGSVAEQVVRYATCNVLSFCPKQGIPLRREVLEKLE